MKFIVSSALLLKNVSLLNGVISSNNTLPILDNFLFKLNGNKLDIIGSDLETTISTSLEVESQDISDIAIPSKMILEVVKTFSNQPLTFVQKENNILEIVSDKGKYQLAFNDSIDYPLPHNIDKPSKVFINCDLLYKGIYKTLFATGNDHLRPMMTGVLFKFTNGVLNLVSTDGHRLVKYSINNLNLDTDFEFIVPKKTLVLLKNIINNLYNDIKDTDIIIEYNEVNTKFSFNKISINCRLIEGKYPNYEIVIPKDNPNLLTIDRLMFLKSIKRLSIFSNKSTSQIKIKLIGNSILLNSEDLFLSNKAEERLPCSYTGEDMEIGFNSKFLIDILNNIDSNDIYFKLSTPKKAGIIVPVTDSNINYEVLMLLMPIILN